MLLLIVCVFVVIWLLVAKWKNKDLVRMAETFKSNIKMYPIVGHGYVVVGNGEKMMNGLQEMGRDAINSKGLAAHWYMSRLYLTVADPEVADVILKNFLEKDELMRFFHEMIGDGSVFAPVEKWRQRRKFLAPTFNMKNLNRFVEVFAAESSIMAGKMNEVAGRGKTAMWNFVSSYAMDAVCGTTMGVQAKAQEGDHPNLIALASMFNIAALRICTPWLHSELLYNLTSWHRTASRSKKMVYSFIDDIIRKKRRTLDDKHNNPKIQEQVKNQVSQLKPFVELVLETAASESDIAIREECLVLLGAGTDTSAVSLGFAFVMMAKHQDVQEKVYKELTEIIKDSNEPVQADDIHRLKYLDAVIRESLRLYPPVPVIVRKIDRSIELPTGQRIPAGCGSIINIWAMHRNPAQWGGDAEEFRPERFLEESQRHPAAFMPFSYGPRNCLGYQYAMMSMKTVLATVLRKYRLQPSGERKLRLEFDVMLRDVDQYPVSVEIR